jgi:ankyrin repeat protein
MNSEKFKQKYFKYKNKYLALKGGNKNNSTLYSAVETGHLEKVRLSLKNSADVNIVNKEKETALHLAAKNGHLEIVRLLLEKGADVNIVNKEKETALHLAAKN